MKPVNLATATEISVCRRCQGTGEVDGPLVIRGLRPLPRRSCSACRGTGHTVSSIPLASSLQRKQP